MRVLRDKGAIFGLVVSDHVPAVLGGELCDWGAIWSSGQHLHSSPYLVVRALAKLVAVNPPKKTISNHTDITPTYPERRLRQPWRRRTVRP